ncbi:MAG: EAL domain-containing protein [Alphaproteobacteria bacterium]|nr:EAL domain-containing protein [Alphaproteobacteria bacterium]
MSHQKRFIVRFALVLFIIAFLYTVSAYGHFSLIKSIFPGFMAGLAMCVAWWFESRISSRWEQDFTALEGDHARLSHEVSELKEHLGHVCDVTTCMNEELRVSNDYLEDQLGEKLDERIETEVKKTRKLMIGHMENLLVLIEDFSKKIAPVSSSSTVTCSVSEAYPAESKKKIVRRFSGYEGFSRLIRYALDHNCVDVYLQPIVTLPQRKLCYYETIVRLRGPKGRVVAPGDDMLVDQKRDLLSALDQVVLDRLVWIISVMKQRKKPMLKLFFRLSARLLSNPDDLKTLVDFLESNAALSECLVFQISQNTLRHAGPFELESLATLHESGFHFSLDRVNDLDIDPRELAKMGFRFAKIDVALLLDDGANARTDIHSSDLGLLLSRYGVSLIGEKINTDHEAFDVLDLNLDLGQGDFFARPRLIVHVPPDNDAESVRSERNFG